MVQVASNLPDMCAARDNATGKPIMIKVGETGYYPLKDDFPVQDFNRGKGITANQVEAMIVGSMFGWTVPGANPANCDGRIASKFV